jgi:hypothetical protein
MVSKDRHPDPESSSGAPSSPLPRVKPSTLSKRGICRKSGGGGIEGVGKDGRLGGARGVGRVGGGGIARERRGLRFP